MIKEFVPKVLLDIEEDLFINKSVKLNESMNEFLNVIDWNIFGSVRYENKYSKYSCMRKMVQLHRHLMKKIPDTSVVLYHVSESNDYGICNDFHTHFLIYAEGFSSTQLKSISDNFLRCFHDTTTDIRCYDKNKNGVEYINKTINWNRDAYGLECNDKNVFLKQSA